MFRSMKGRDSFGIDRKEEKVYLLFARKLLRETFAFSFADEELCRSLALVYGKEKKRLLCVKR